MCKNKHNQAGEQTLIKSLFRLCRAFSKKINEDSIAAYSAQAAFFIILSFFPFVMFLLTLLQYLPFSKDELFNTLSGFAPAQIAELIKGFVNEIYNSSSGTLLSVTVIVALWTASKGSLALQRGLNSVYGIRETRNYFLLRLRATIYTLIFSVLLICLLALFVFGNQISLLLSTHFPIINEFALLIISVRTLVGLCVLIIFFVIIYKFIPNRKSGIFRELPGAVTAAVGWLGFSYLYSFYIDNMSNMAATYGSLTAIVLCMLWLYFCMSILLFGAEINSVLANPVVRTAIRHFFSRKKELPSVTDDTEHPASSPHSKS